MALQKNRFKVALAEGRRQVGLWLALANPISAELLGGLGYDWLVIDLEHAPNDLRSAVAQMQALSAFPVEAVIRPPVGENWVLKQLLDAGCRTLLIPMVESAAQARQMVKAVRYPPHGCRGVGAGLARASRYGAEADYLGSANDDICLLLQIESRQGLAALDEIAAVDGVDGIFIGPADLAADMGFLGRPKEQAVQVAILDAFARLKGAGKKSGVLTSDPGLISHYISLGVDFIAVGSDVGVLRDTASALLYNYAGSPVSPGK